jgi:hypothetical protein
MKKRRLVKANLGNMSPIQRTPKSPRNAKIVKAMSIPLLHASSLFLMLTIFVFITFFDIFLKRGPSSRVD